MIPAIYHLEAKIITRGVGRSAVAASAYMSCSEITNEYDGVKHDYTRKGGLVYERIFLPSHAPPEWCDRSKLWNAVEETEKTRDSRLAREFIVALPVEVSCERQIAEAEEFAKALVDDGMCVDVCIHDTGEGNPHAHIMATVRPLNPDGTWQEKPKKNIYVSETVRRKALPPLNFYVQKMRVGKSSICSLLTGRRYIFHPQRLTVMRE